MKEREPKKPIKKKEKQELIDEVLWDEHKNDKEPEDLQDLTDYLEPYQNDYGENY
jgi:uncharacterized protein YozE (UPF0346 family)